MDNLMNFFQPTQLIATCGQPRAESFVQIAAAGYYAVVNLAMTDSEGALENEGALVANAGMNYVHIPVPFDQPSASHVQQFFKIMDAFEGKQVLVHCAVNARVSAFVYKYLDLLKGFPPAQISSPLLLEWFPKMGAEWQAIMNLSLDDIEFAQ